jgi:hypothetical protein
MMGGAPLNPNVSLHLNGISSGSQLDLYFRIRGGAKMRIKFGEKKFQFNISKSITSSIMYSGNLGKEFDDTNNLNTKIESSFFIHKKNQILFYDGSDFLVKRIIEGTFFFF